MTDRHTFSLIVDDGFVSLTTHCPYDVADDTRPCRAHLEDGTLDPVYLGCDYIEWIELRFDDVTCGLAENRDYAQVLIAADHQSDEAIFDRAALETVIEILTATLKEMPLT